MITESRKFSPSLQKHQPRHGRWTALLLASLILLGDVFCFDPSRGTLSRFLSLSCDSSVRETASVSQFCSLFYSHDGIITATKAYFVSCIVGVIASFAGGIIVDKQGEDIVILVSIIALLVGQLLQALGALLTQFSGALVIFLTGDLITSISSCSLFVAVLAFISYRFVGHELAFAIGICLSLSRIARIINDHNDALLASRSGISVAAIIGTLISLLSFALVIYLRRVNKSCCEQYELCSDSEISDCENAKIASSNEDVSSDTPSETSSLLRKSSNGSLEMNNLRSTSSASYGGVDSPPQRVNDMESNNTYIFSNSNSLSPIRVFPWLVLVSVVFYATVVPFAAVSREIITELYFPREISAVVQQGGDESANSKTSDDIEWLQALPMIICAALSPFICVFVDRLGCRTLLIALAPTLLLLSHLALVTNVTGPLGPLLLIGIAYSMFASALWPSIAILVVGNTYFENGWSLSSRSNNSRSMNSIDSNNSSSSKSDSSDETAPGPRRLGTAFGVTSAVLSLSQALCPTLLTWALAVHQNVATAATDTDNTNTGTKSNSYRSLEALFVTLSLLSQIVAIWLWHCDEKHGALLRTTMLGCDKKSSSHAAAVSDTVVPCNCNKSHCLTCNEIRDRNYFPNPHPQLHYSNNVFGHIWKYLHNTWEEIKFNLLKKHSKVRQSQPTQHGGEQFEYEVDEFEHNHVVINNSKLSPLMTTWQIQTLKNMQQQSQSDNQTSEMPISFQNESIQSDFNANISSAGKSKCTNEVIINSPKSGGISYNSHYFYSPLVHENSNEIERNPKSDEIGGQVKPGTAMGMASMLSMPQSQPEENLDSFDRIVLCVPQKSDDYSRSDALELRRFACERSRLTFQRPYLEKKTNNDKANKAKKTSPKSTLMRRNSFF